VTVVKVKLCPPCGGYEPTGSGFADRGVTLGQCDGCGGSMREIHWFDSVLVRGGCGCAFQAGSRHESVEATA